MKRFLLGGLVALAVVSAGCRPAPTQATASAGPSPAAARALDDGVHYGEDRLVSPRGAGFRAVLPAPPSGRQDASLPAPWIDATYWYAEPDSIRVALVGFADAMVPVTIDTALSTTARSIAESFPTARVDTRPLNAATGDLLVNGPRWSANLRLQAMGARLFVLLISCVQPCDLAEAWDVLTAQFSMLPPQRTVSFARGATLASAAEFDTVYDTSYAFTRLDTPASLRQFRAVEPSQGRSSSLGRFAVRLALMAANTPIEGAAERY